MSWCVGFLDEDERDRASGVASGKACNGAGQRLRRLANHEHQSGRDDFGAAGPAGSAGGKRERDRSLRLSNHNESLVISSVFYEETTPPHDKLRDRHPSRARGLTLKPL